MRRHATGLAQGSYLKTRRLADRRAAPARCAHQSAVFRASGSEPTQGAWPSIARVGLVRCATLLLCLSDPFR